MLKSYVRIQSLMNAMRREDGNAAEYGLIIALVAVVIIGGLTALGVALSGKFGEVTTELNK
ncbi:MAG TPA: Flp family type IVb pilin [Candidatus Lumbricidophila sp.]|nr:Flp family type IVb pilin [Candidatus Lumbricidophila sp.]